MTLAENLFLTGEFVPQLRFQHFLEAEPLGDAEGHGRNGDDGDQRIEGQGRRTQLALVFVKSTD